MSSIFSIPVLDKKWTLKQADETDIQHLQDSLGLSSIFCRLLVQRGIKTKEAAIKFFRPSLQDLHDPFLMKDMDIAVSRLEKAILNKEKILLFGDYDVDGTTAVAMMFSFLKQLTANLDFYIPDRAKEGYGLSASGIEYAKETNADLILAMDLGIKAIRSVEKSNNYNIDVIICDHHLPGEQLPYACAVLDPKRTDCPYPYKELSGCGIAFKLAQAYAQKNEILLDDLTELLDLVAVSIACDIVPLTGENRVLAYYGLKKFNLAPGVGVQTLKDISNRNKTFTISDIVFGIGPLLNAAGRLADAKIAVRMLVAETPEEAKKEGKLLYELNETRKLLDANMQEEAITLLQSHSDWEQQKCIVLYKPDWNKGILGITAARLVEQFHKPTILLTLSEGKLVGSARSVKGLNIHNALEHCSEWLENFGGHFFAAGLTLRLENLSNFKIEINNFISENISPENIVPEISIDSEISLSHIHKNFWRILKRFAPFGPENRRPVFSARHVSSGPGTRKLSDGQHLKMDIRSSKNKSFSGIAFNQGHAYESFKYNFSDICFSLEENYWKGQRTLQLQIKDIQIP